MPKLVKGFTLIELLVVISIIAVLSAIGLTSYRTFLQNSRDSRRQADLKLIQTALEDYHSDQLYYPTSVTSGSSLVFGSKTYLNTVPSDPKGAVYTYTPSPSGCDNTSANCTSYCLYTTFEIMNLASESGCSAAPPYGVTRP